MGLGEFKIWWKTSYDKISLFVVLFGLLVSALLLAIWVGSGKHQLATSGEDPSILKKAAKQTDLTYVQEAVRQLEEPFQMSETSNRMMVAEIRIACIKCGKPIRYLAEKCPFCGTAQPKPKDTELIDGDQDGLPDTWEKKYGLNPMNPDDAQKDTDADGFTNMEEYYNKTDPSNPKSLPPVIAKLRLLKASRIPVTLTFQSVQRLTQTNVLYSIKNRVTGQDYYKKMGDKVEGYEIVGFEEKFEDVVKGSVKLKHDVSVLTLRKDKKDIQLRIGQDSSAQGDLVANMIFLIDDSRFRVKVGDTIPLKADKYRVVDIRQDNILVSNVATGTETEIPLYTEADKKPVRRDPAGEKKDNATKSEGQ